MAIFDFNDLVSSFKDIYQIGTALQTDITAFQKELRYSDTIILKCRKQKVDAIS